MPELINSNFSEMETVYKAEYERMVKAGYTEGQIEEAFDRLIRIQNMVTMAVM